MNQNREAFVNLIKHQGQINGRYSSLELISDKGFFSILFKGFDQLLGKKVALKFYDPDKELDVYRLKCFQREAELLQKLKGQPNIIELVEGLSNLEITLSYVQTGIQFKKSYNFYVMELAESDFEQYIYLGTADFNVIKKLTYFREVCKGVARIHRQAICHRDLKPNNFLICRGGTVKMSDLGTANQLNKQHILQEYSMPVGDMGYMAPELICGIGICDEHVFSADIFSLGAILFEMFTKTKLTSKIYDVEFIKKLISFKNYLEGSPAKNRKQIYNETIDTIVTPHRLPDIYSYNDLVPSSIKHNLNDLYKQLAVLNYAKRLCDFNSIIRKIDICILILKKERLQQLRRQQKIRTRERV